MRKAAQAEFDTGCDLPTVTLKVDFVNCSDAEEYRQYAALTDIFLGDSVRVVARRIGVEVSMRMTQYTYDCLTRKYTSVTLGTAADTLEGSGGLLTGMIYCGECGERLTINHCRKVTDTLEGQREYRWSVYRCYRKINSRKTCTGQSTYNAKRIDEAVLSIVRSFFARITTLPEADQMQAAMQRENLIREKAIQTAEDDVEKATKALSALEDEALKTLSGESKLTLDTISKLIEKQKAKQTDARMKLQALLEEKQTDDEKFKAKQEQLQRTKEWAQILDIATPPRKQMILAEIIDRVEVRRGYEITVKFKLTAQQFLDPNGCEAISKIAS